MKLKSNVRVITTDNYIIQLDNENKHIAEEDIYIIKAMLDGITDENDLLQIIMKTEDIDEIIAGFRLTQFVIDYGKYLAEPDENIVIDI